MGIERNMLTNRIVATKGLLVVFVYSVRQLALITASLVIALFVMLVLLLR